MNPPHNLNFNRPRPRSRHCCLKLGISLELGGWNLVLFPHHPSRITHSCFSCFSWLKNGNSALRTPHSAFRNFVIRILLRPQTQDARPHPRRSAPTPCSQNLSSVRSLKENLSVASASSCKNRAAAERSCISRISRLKISCL